MNADAPDDTNNYKKCRKYLWKENRYAERRENEEGYCTGMKGRGKRSREF